ncbi:PCP degradation transcriptional activation protein [Paraburkholderia kirstenboschensis]|uniref:LysR family transcriptional regulator n=1 Tax=Paraburkholderia dipogonis TaxID=1211383 RepID=A0A4Y8MGA7_9BURK|nr:MULTISPECIES: LysR family transcriptional regulator [Paraburkholderia]TFE36496.1 LysR family transcriptional regulator [Paraburkholderia dipogonis]CAD6560644.1 PCP degradation transcriptional activation protein [Paraburkholderia kirstenboschensis]
MIEIDVKLLNVFAETYRTGSVTQAAENLGLSQPTISFNLSKLRDHYKDPLFVRTSRGMEATPFAQELYEQVVDLLASFSNIARLQTSFDPAEAQRIFRIAMTDISQIVLLPTLLNKLRIVAPGVQLRISHITTETPRLLENGEVELAVGFMPQLDAGFYQQKLFPQRFVVLAASRHAGFGDSMSLDAYLSAGHVAVTPSGTGHSIIDRTLREQQLHRHVVLDVPNYLAIADIVAQTDLLATVPQKLADLMSSSVGARRFPVPFEIPQYDVKQHWHARTHQDAGHRWLRALLAELFLETETPTLGTASG